MKQEAVKVEGKESDAKSSKDSKEAKQSSAAAPSSGAVVYWMSRDQRVNDNWGLLTAQYVSRLWQ